MSEDPLYDANWKEWILIVRDNWALLTWPI